MGRHWVCVERGKTVEMSTIIRPEISVKNKYWISRHRYYELKHFCLQYPEWKKEYAYYREISIPSPKLRLTPSSTNVDGSATERHVINSIYLSERINLIEKLSIEADNELNKYILKAVTEGLSYEYLKVNLDIPCGKDMYYDRYRRFFWLLSEARM